MAKKILITGGAGFIGSWLAERLLEQGNEVFIIDDLSTGRFENIEHLTSNPKFHYEIDTIFNETLLKIFVDRCDNIYHLAAAVGVKRVMEQPLASLETNIKGTELVLRSAEKKKKPVLITSSSEVYGKNDALPFSEDHHRVYGSAYNYRWGYAFSKAIDEFIALAYWRERGLPTIVVRLFNTVGPRQTSHYGMVLPTFVRQCLEGEPITIHGNGEQTRCFSDVEDVVDGLIKLMNSEKAVGEIFNLGSQEEISMKDLALKIKEMTGSSSELKHIPHYDVYGEGFEDMERRVPNITKIREVVGYEPKYSLHQIIERVIAYHKDE